MYPVVPRAASVFLLVLVAASPACAEALGDPLPEGALARLGTARFRNPNRNLCAALALDGKRLAMADAGEVVLLDPSDGRELARFGTEGDAVTQLRFSPSGKRLLSVRASKGAQLWDVASGKELGRLESAHMDWFLAFTTGDQALAVRTESKVGVLDPLSVWDVASGKEVARLNVIHNSLVKTAISWDGKAAATWGGYHDGSDRGPKDHRKHELQLWDLGSSKEKARIDTGGAHVENAAFSPNGAVLAVATSEARVQLWDAAVGLQLHSFALPMGFTDHIAFSPDGKTFFAASEYGGVRSWDVASGKRLRLPPGPPCSFRGLTFPPGGKVVGWGYGLCAVFLWDVRSGRELTPTTGHRVEVDALSFSPDGKALWSGDADGELREWDAASFQLRGRQNVGGPRDGRPGPCLPHFSPDRRYVVIEDSANGGFDGSSLIERETGEEVCRFATGYGVGKVAFSSNGDLLATCLTMHQDGPALALWDVASGRERRFLGTKGERSHPVFSSDDRLLAVSVSRSDGYGVEVWDAVRGKVLRTLEAGEVESVGLSFSPEGRLLASAAATGELIVWETDSGRTAYSRKLEARISGAPVFSPDGRVLAVGAQESGRGTVQVFEVATWQRRLKRSGHVGEVLCLVYSPDGRILASGGADTTVLVWDMTGRRAATGLTPKPSAKDLRKAWQALAAADAERAERAIRRLSAAPAEAVPLLTRQVRPSPKPSLAADGLARLVDRLDDESFAEREKAEGELKDLGRAAEKSLLKALDGKPSLELKRRARELLDRLDDLERSPEALRQRRAVEVLERTATPEAQKLLAALADGEPSALLTREARAALGRLRRLPQADP